MDGFGKTLSRKNPLRHGKNIQYYTLKEKPNELEIETASIISLFTKMMICYLHIFYLARKKHTL